MYFNAKENRRKKMTQKRMERIVRGRRRAQGIGAFTGAFTVFAILGLIFGGDMKKEAKKIAEEVQGKIPEQAKNVIEDAKEKLPEQAKNAIEDAKEKLGM